MYSVYVEGLPFNWSVEKLKETFGKCGDIVEVRAPTWHDSGRLKGYGFVVFSEDAAFTKALAMDGEKVESDRYIKVSETKGKMDPAPRNQSISTAKPSSTIFVKNIPYQTSEEELGSVFEKFGKLKDVRIVTENGRSKGFAYLDFESVDSAKAVMSSPTIELSGRPLHVDFGSGERKAGFHYRKEAYDSKFFNKSTGQFPKGSSAGRPKGSSGDRHSASGHKGSRSTEHRGPKRDLMKAKGGPREGRRTRN